MKKKIAQRPVATPETLLSQNIALNLLEQHSYDNADASALFALSSLLGDYAKEIGQQIKANAEVSGRATPNLLDAMLAAEEYGMTKETQLKHLRQVPTSEERGLWRRGTLNDVSHKASEEIKRRLVKNEVEQIDRLKQNELNEFQDKLNTVLVEKGDEK